MLDLRPVGYVIGLLVASLGLTMLGPLVADLLAGNGHWFVFFESAVITVLTGGLVAVACSNGVTAGLSLRQTVLLTSLVWLCLPIRWRGIDWDRSAAWLCFLVLRGSVCASLMASLSYPSIVGTAMYCIKRIKQRHVVDSRHVSTYILRIR